MRARWLIGLAVSVCAVAHAAEPAPQPVAKEILRTGRTVSDQPLRLPEGAAEVVGMTVDLPAGARLPAHRHPWLRVGYVESGRIGVRNLDTGSEFEFGPGTMVPEAIGQWHESWVVGSEPVRLIVFDLVPPGVENNERRAQE